MKDVTEPTFANFIKEGHAGKGLTQFMVTVSEKMATALPITPFIFIVGGAGIEPATSIGLKCEVFLLAETRMENN